MGFSPRQIDEMTLWEFTAITVAWSKANGGSTTPSAPTDDEHDALLKKYA